jgi:hypothetical protein
MDEKKWWQSKGVWTGIVIIVIATLTAIDAQFNVGLMNNPITQVILAMLGAMGVYSRVTADTKIQ